MTPTSLTLQSVLVGLVPALLVAIVTAYVTVHLALNRFRQERWWERKAQAYAELFEALFDVQWYSRRRLDQIEEARQFAAGYFKQLSDRASAGYLTIRKYAAIGPFLFSPGTASRLAKLEKTLDRETFDLDPAEDLSGHIDAVTAALKDLQTLAHRDLGLRLPPDGA